MQNNKSAPAQTTENHENPQNGSKPDIVEPILAPGPSEKGFLIALYLEHLDEIDFLFSQCHVQLDNPDTHWPDAEAYEQRLAAHIDAIKLGGDLALACTKQLLSDDDEEKIQAAAYTLVTVGGSKFMADIIRCMENADPDILPYFIEPLKHTPYSLTSKDVAPLFSHPHPEMRLAAVAITDYRKESCTDYLAPLIEDEDPSVSISSAVAMARLKHPTASNILEQQISLDQDSKLQKKATLSLLTMGMLEGVQHLHKLLKTELPPIWALEYLSLCGNAQDLEKLQKINTDQDYLIGALSAMGILGNIQAVNTLLSALDGQADEIKVAAARSLHRLTGAELLETIEVEEQPDPDDLVEGEESTLSIKTKIERICTSQTEWTAWWNKNQARFRSNVFFRYGIPFHFEQCIDEIASETIPIVSRRRAYLELVIRADLDEHFEPDWPVNKQLAAIRRMQIWWQSNRDRFPPGKWYFHARIL